MRGQSNLVAKDKVSVPRTENAGNSRRLDLLTVGLTALIGLIHLPYPFGGDQALFTIYARKLNQGAVLYRDLWDVKQPGIYVFYLLAGKLFGFTEVGVHAFELVYLICFSTVLIFCCRGYFRSWWAASLVPLFTVALYYGIADSNHLTQLEPLVGFPLFLSCYWISRAAQTEERPARLLVLSGFAAGLLAVFKLVLLPIPLGFWLLSSMFTAYAKKQSPLRQIFHWAPFILIGAFLPALAVFLWFLEAHSVRSLMYASFVYPFEAIRQLQPQQRTGTLVLSLQWFISSFAALIALAFSTAYMTIAKHKDIFSLNLVVWIVVGFGVIMIQRYSWWEYHFFILLTPLGILATKAIDDAWIAITALVNSRAFGFTSRLRTRRIVFTSCVTLLFSPVLGSSAVLSMYLIRHHFARTEKDRITFQGKVNPVYQIIGTDVSFLSDQNSLKGDIFVFGDPRYYYLAGRDQAIPLNGDNPEIMIPEQWMQMEQDLARTLPVYVYLSDYLSGDQSRYAHAIVTIINEHYEPLRRSATGTWYMARNRIKSHFAQP